MTVKHHQAKRVGGTVVGPLGVVVLGNNTGLLVQKNAIVYQKCIEYSYFKYILYSKPSNFEESFIYYSSKRMIQLVFNVYKFLFFVEKEKKRNGYIHLFC